MTSPRVLTATFAALLAGLSLAGCTAKKSATTEQGKAPGAQVTVNATDTACDGSGFSSTAELRDCQRARRPLHRGPLLR